jgi:hypothetical protein
MIIGVSGFSGSGKDTVADVICQNPAYTKLALADGIKRICHEVFAFSYGQLWGPSSTRNAPDLRYPRAGGHLTPRYALQTLGSEWGRGCYEHIWVELALRISNQLLTDPKTKYSPVEGVRSTGQLVTPLVGVLITDVRFRNEMEMLRASGAKLVRVRRLGLETPPYDHPSETEQTTVADDFFDYVIHNDGSLDDLSLKCVAMMEEFSK